MTRLYRGSKISRMLEDKKQTDKRMAAADRTDWYLPRENLLSEKAVDLFHLSLYDSATKEFLDDSYAISNSMCVQTWYALASTLLSVFVTKTSSNGILNRGGMFIFSAEHLREFLALPAEWNRKGKRLLDLGAGDGGVTTRAGDFYEHIFVTEMSTVMQWRLRERGFEVLDVDEWYSGSKEFDLISVLNLLDRHYDPIILLAQLHQVASRNNCPVMMAVVLPVRQYVEFHPTSKTTRADSKINVNGTTYESHVNSMIGQVFEPAGFEVIRWTKLPYLCEGDMQKPYYILYDALFLLRAVEKPVTTTQQQSSAPLIHSEL